MARRVLQPKRIPRECAASRTERGVQAAVLSRKGAVGGERIREKDAKSAEVYSPALARIRHADEIWDRLETWALAVAHRAMVALTARWTRLRT
jgi:hypothetical protein